MKGSKKLKFEAHFLWQLEPYPGGSILVFDELVNFPYFEQQELRAFYEFLQTHPWKLRVLQPGTREQVVRMGFKIHAVDETFSRLALANSLSLSTPLVLTVTVRHAPWFFLTSTDRFAELFRKE